jgi:hypothetical protein
MPAMSSIIRVLAISFSKELFCNRRSELGHRDILSELQCMSKGGTTFFNSISCSFHNKNWFYPIKTNKNNNLLCPIKTFLNENPFCPIKTFQNKIRFCPIKTFQTLSRAQQRCAHSHPCIPYHRIRSNFCCKRLRKKYTAATSSTIRISIELAREVIESNDYLRW